MNYEHLKEIKITIKPGILVLNDRVGLVGDEFYNDMQVIYSGNDNGSAWLEFRPTERLVPKIGYSKKELLTISNFLKDIAETL